ncbi:hypothetical protein [Sphingobacterium rhinopitheci]|uniref:hypothetical protein n=1 Tax=Sphingobacterium rhinopitheci TaxID=2781960 RepID=UPI001F51A0CF|nr:hypothetical protein [Sphingobacterium rhinopitheci]
MLQLKYIFTTLCLLFTLQFSSFAQRNNFEAIESEKVAYITKQLKLTPSEAQRFFPVYNKYNDLMWQLKAEKKRQRQDVISFDAKEVEIKKQYRNEFAKVIGQSRASQFFQVVEDFNDMLRHTLQNRQNSRHR